jgi:TetR/AcrR family tetracycline transcriptional repressor
MAKPMAPVAEDDVRRGVVRHRPRFTVSVDMATSWTVCNIWTAYRERCTRLPLSSRGQVELMSVSGIRRRGRRRTLTEDEILDAALSLLDDGGADAASVRGIAARVGVAPNAVYTYFPDKAAVIKALVERLLGGVDHDVFADRERPWRERVEALALELRAHLSAHPGAVPLLVGGPMDGVNALALNERLLQLLADAGLDSTDAARASYLLIVYVFGSIALEVADVHQAGPLPPESERVTTRQAAFSATPTDGFPRSAEAAATMAGYISTEQYLWGLRRILDGIAARVAAPGGREPAEMHVGQAS